MNKKYIYIPQEDKEGGNVSSFLRKLDMQHQPFAEGKLEWLVFQGIYVRNVSIYPGGARKRGI